MLPTLPAYQVFSLLSLGISLRAASTLLFPLTRCNSPPLVAYRVSPLLQKGNNNEHEFTHADLYALSPTEQSRNLASIAEQWDAVVAQHNGKPSKHALLKLFASQFGNARYACSFMILLLSLPFLHQRPLVYFGRGTTWLSSRRA